MKTLSQQLVNKRQSRSGFTLLELIVVIAILAIIAGALLAAYDGLERRAGRSQSSFNSSGVDRAVRTFKVLNGSFPDRLDNLCSGNANIDILASDLVTKAGLTPYQIQSAETNALARAGLTAVMQAGSAAVRTAMVGKLMNRALDTTPDGIGTLTALSTGSYVAQVTSTNLLKSIANLGRPADRVIALGLGQSSSIVKPTSSTGSGFASAPFFTNVRRDEYGRFLLLFQTVSDENGNGAIDAGEQLTEARFVGVIDALGNFIEENALGAVN